MKELREEILQFQEQIKDRAFKLTAEEIFWFLFEGLNNGGYEFAFLKMQTLVNAGCKVNEDVQLRSPLNFALVRNFDVAKILLEFGANPNGLPNDSQSLVL